MSQTLDFYGVRLLKEKLIIEVMGVKMEIKLSWVSGMIGAMPVFDSFDSALSYADGDEDRVFKLSATE